MKILVCGGRDYHNKDKIYSVLYDYAECTDEYPLGKNIVTIIAGGAKGADSIAADWAITTWNRLLEFPANWDLHGGSAGPIRNKRMLEEGQPDLVLAFPGGRGTANMIAQARKAGVPVRIIENENKKREGQGQNV